MNSVRHYLLAVQFFTRIPVTGRLADWVGYSPAIDIVASQSGRTVATVTTAKPLTAEQAERLRATIAGAVTPTRQGAVWVTISVGLTLLTPADQSTAAPLHRADQALYAAKRHGRNTICGGD